ncbi:MAG: type II CRISPR RNA-guided endonuclease Cas9 [Bacteroides sp.]|nr:type II CRISPR RNA-guided endonuclease Cas9 [Bacteroides sp.]
MTKINENYILGLNVNTDSTGWVAMDSKNKLLKLKGKTAIGTRLFDEGQTAADRRLFRSTRRRLRRRKWRLNLLNEIFDEEIAKVDPYFFARLKASNVSSRDARKTFRTIVFPTRKEEIEYNRTYPTIYHLRRALMFENRKFDIREVYLAIHHIVKYRGNSLQDTPVQNFNASDIDIKESLEKINKGLANIDNELSLTLANENSDKINEILLDKKLKGQNKKKQISALLLSKNLDKNTKKVTKKVADQITNGILGYKINFDVILGQKISKDEKTAWQFKLCDADASEKIEDLLAKIDENSQTIVTTINELFSSIILTSLVDSGKTLSETMVRKFENHEKDLDLLMEVIKSNADEDKSKNLQAAYNLYVNNRREDLLEAKETLKIKGSLNQEDFYSIIKKNLDDSKESKQILDEIELNTFMPKQRTNDNGVIPYQLHQIELDKIIENQGKYYPFLKEKNPVKKHQKQAPYKLDELVRFKVPYYVGPLITEEDQKRTSGANFAWMIRKERGRITPWNFDEKVDRVATANKFIKRMTTKDTYLFGEDVLPANSLIYQEYVVLDELNKISLNGKKLPIGLKRDIVNKIFKTHSTVSVATLRKFLQNNYNYSYINIEGLADPTKFNASLSTYNKLSKIDGFGEKLEQKKYQKDIENIIEWSTIFEDRDIYVEKLQEIDWLNSDQIKELAKIRLQGWGRLSKKLLTGLVDNNGQTILQNLWNTKKTFISIINKSDFKSLIEAENAKVFVSEDLEDILEDAYTSPANKKAIRQAISVVDDIVKASNDQAPSLIAINTTRHPDISQSRTSYLSKSFSELDDELIDDGVKEEFEEALKNRVLSKDKVFLYFSQGGRDPFTGEKINYKKLDTNYHVIHVLPSSFIGDNSIDNKILVKNEINEEEKFAYEYANQVVPDKDLTLRQLWEEWKKDGLMSKKKLTNFLTDPEHLNETQNKIFIDRQLTDNSQIIKLVTAILNSKFPEAKIISVKTGYINAIRENGMYQLYKNTLVNDYYPAMDAYISATIANYLNQAYPSLRPYFVYGEYERFRKHPEFEKEILQQISHFNFIWALLNKKHADELKVSRSNKLIFSRQKDIIDNLQRAYNFKFINISRATYTKNGQLFGMTLFPRLDRDTAKTRTLIPKKEGLDTSIYGGYSNNENAFMSVIKIKKGKQIKYKVVGIPVRAISNLNNTKNKKEYRAVLSKYIAAQGFKEFEIIKEKLPYEQTIIDGKRKFRLGSAKYLRNAKQLTLSKESMRIISGHIEEDEDKRQLYISVFNEILEKMDKYLPIFDINKNRQKLHDKAKQFSALEPNEMKEVIDGILIALENNGKTMNLKPLKIASFGQLQMTSGIDLSKNAILIYDSPTGLFEKQFKLTE